MSDAIDKLLKQGEPGALRLGDVQRHRLQQLARRHCGTAVWDGSGLVEAPDMTVIVLNSATAPRVETLIRSLHENSIVIVPFGENPAFDFLKSKLHGYGSIGSQGTMAPHHIWWGGVKPLSVPTGLYRREDTLFVSSFERRFPIDERAAQLATALERLGLNRVIEGATTDITATASGVSKIGFIIRQWERANRPIFWIAPDANVCQHPLLPQSLGCDFAIHKKRSGAIDAGAVFFHQTEPARALLDIWYRLSRDYPDLPEAFLLDQAWTLVSSQRQIETAWLPDSYWQSGDLQTGDRATVIQCDRHTEPQIPDEYLALRIQHARRFGRHQAPEAHLIMQGPVQTRGPITVLIRDVLAGNARSVSGAIEAAAQAFATDPGGFSQMEVVLCAWDNDVDSVMQIEDDSWVLVTDPSERLQPHAFSKLGDSKLGSARPIYSAATAQNSASIFRLADPSLGVRLKRSGKYHESFLKRPPWPTHSE